MRQRTNLNVIVKLTSAVFEAERAQLAKVISRELGLRSQLAELNKTRTDQSQVVRLTNDPALIANADIKWHRWIDQRRTILNAELAQVIALKSIRHAELQLAFGRNKAMDSLASKRTMSEKRAALNKAIYAS